MQILPKQDKDGDLCTKLSFAKNYAYNRAESAFSTTAAASQEPRASLRWGLGHLHKTPGADYLQNLSQQLWKSGMQWEHWH